MLSRLVTIATYVSVFRLLLTWTIRSHTELMTWMRGNSSTKDLSSLPSCILNSRRSIISWLLTGSSFKLPLSNTKMLGKLDEKYERLARTHCHQKERPGHGTSAITVFVRLLQNGWTTYPISPIEACSELVRTCLWNGDGDKICKISSADNLAHVFIKEA